jgi:hypothetical protein
LINAIIAEPTTIAENRYLLTDSSNIAKQLSGKKGHPRNKGARSDHLLLDAANFSAEGLKAIYE